MVLSGLVDPPGSSALPAFDLPPMSSSREEGFVLCSIRNAADGLHLGFGVPFVHTISNSDEFFKSAWVNRGIISRAMLVDSFKLHRADCNRHLF